MHRALLLRSIAIEHVAHIRSHTLLIYLVRACAYARESSDGQSKHFLPKGTPSITRLELTVTMVSEGQIHINRFQDVTWTAHHSMLPSQLQC